MLFITSQKLGAPCFKFTGVYFCWSIILKFTFLFPLYSSSIYPNISFHKRSFCAVLILTCSESFGAFCYLGMDLLLLLLPVYISLSPWWNNHFKFYINPILSSLTAKNKRHIEINNNPCLCLHVKKNQPLNFSFFRKEKKTGVELYRLHCYIFSLHWLQ